MDPEQSNSADMARIKTTNERLRLLFSWVLVSILTVVGMYFLVKLAGVHKTEGDYWSSLIREQFPVLVGLPMAGLGALFLTLILQISTGSLEFDIAGVKFRGAAAPIVFWLICFLSIVVAIALLWQN
ncbi:MAG: hypothetical protein SV765_03480 [Pseudomonadota bacterium]|nr:hypothetical protein [Pseudomonadales bacterium]MDY6919255.1 hypothetical protein [Pseudomonadota bacterium]